MFIERAFCPSCSSNEVTTIYSCLFEKKPVIDFFERKFTDVNVIKQFSGHSYSLNECLDCSLIYQTTILDEKHTEELYNDWLINSDAENLDEDRKDLQFDRAVYFAQEVAMIISFLRKQAEQIRILDYGMGRGRWCKMAQAFGCSVYGTDLSDTLMNEANKFGIKTLPVSDLKNHKFDFINTEQVFEHLAYPLEVLTGLRESLTTNGIIKISVPDGTNLKNRLDGMDWKASRRSKKFLMPATPLIHINTFNNASIEKMGKKAGLKVVNVPLRNTYCLLHSSSSKTLFKSMLRPLYRRIFNKTYVFLQKN